MGLDKVGDAIIKYIIIILLLFVRLDALGVESVFYKDKFKIKKDDDYVKDERKLLLLLAKDKENAELWYQLGLTQRYQDKLLEAFDSQNKANKLLPENVDIKLELARLYNLKMDFNKAESLVKEVVAAYPNYKEAKELEVRIKRNKLFNINSELYKWNINTGYRHSNYSRVSAPNAYASFFQLGNWVTKDTLIYARLEDSESFNNRTKYYELGVAHILNDIYNVSFGTGYSTDSELIMKSAASAKVINNHKFLGDAWITTNIKQYRYKDIKVTTIKPGIRYTIIDNVQISGRYIKIIDNGKNLNGWDARIDWQTPIEKLRLFGGSFEESEMEDYKEINTKAYFTGFSFAFTSQVTLRMSYTHEEEENSSIKQVSLMALSLKF
jgi:YaiO family outer membrane protein